MLLYHTEAPQGEGFYIASCPGKLTAVSGGSDTGVLYGRLELVGRIRSTGVLPEYIAYGDAPSFSLRGPAIGLQKTTVEPPRQTYEYPITPGRFPWFYDRALWLDFLDMLLEQRCNIVYLWSGHPFSSLVKLEDYPEALEVTEEEFALNVETFRWLTQEADRRGIWVVMKFYNIHIPLPFAEKHGLKLHQPKPPPLTSDYYKKSIAAFVRSFPNVGLMVCLGEALQGQIYGVEWFNETILAGLLEGLRGLNVKEKPPIILRSHAIEPQKVIEAARRSIRTCIRRPNTTGNRLPPIRRGEMAGHSQPARLAADGAHRERSYSREPGAFPLRGAFVHPKMHAGGQIPAEGKRAAFIPVVFLGLALFAGCGGAETEAAGPGLDLVRGLVSLCMESGPRSGSGKALLERAARPKIRRPGSGRSDSGCV
ncbi:hypothetical protein LJK87_20830 [Paenibacillus sp. P25]|nr:hypothetical protein LJK87_20830 [Paenibacillus sp. P25]